MNPASPIDLTAGGDDVWQTMPARPAPKPREAPVNNFRFVVNNCPYKTVSGETFWPWEVVGDLCGTEGIAKFLCCAAEIAPTTGMNHMQGFLITKKPCRASSVLNAFAELGFNGALHPNVLHADKGVQVNYDYVLGNCAKKNFEKNPRFFEFGEEPAQVLATKGQKEIARWDQARDLAVKGDFASIDSRIMVSHYQNLKQICVDASAHKDVARLTEMPGVWIWGPAGTGKSFLAREMTGPDAYIKNANKWWCGYKQAGGTPAICDDIDPAHHVLTHHFKLWADIYPFTAEVKGGSIICRPSMMVFTSQYHPDSICTDDEARDAMFRRCKIIKLTMNLRGERVQEIEPHSGTGRPRDFAPSSVPGTARVFNAPALNASVETEDEEEIVYAIRTRPAVEQPSQAMEVEERLECRTPVPLVRSRAVLSDDSLGPSPASLAATPGSTAEASIFRDANSPETPGFPLERQDNIAGGKRIRFG